MKRALLAVVAVALVLAVPAAARLPVYENGSSVGEGLPFKAYATITPTVHLFGDSVTAKIAIVADTKLVDPSRLQVRASFSRTADGVERPSRSGGPLCASHVDVDAPLHHRTLRAATSPSDKFHVFKFPPAASNTSRSIAGPAYGINASWPPVEVLSQVSPGVAAFLRKTNHLNWRTGLTPVAAPTYRVSPNPAVLGRTRTRRPPRRRRSPPRRPLVSDRPSAAGGASGRHRHAARARTCRPALRAHAR